MFTRPLLAVLFALTAFPTFADTGVYQQLLDASVWIVDPNTGSRGSGVVIDAERGLAVTNYHVVGESRNVAIFFAAFDGEGQLVTNRDTYLDNVDTLMDDGLACVGRVIGTWEARDLALVEIKTVPTDVTAVPLADTGATPGDAVHSVGNPGASESLWVYSPGNVRQVYRCQANLDGVQQVDARMLEVTSPINPGDSGSGIVNSAGELIGIVSNSSRRGRLMSYAIDITEVKAFLQSYGMTPGPSTTTIAGDFPTTMPVSWPQ
ncbi:MAG: serine protease [Planctomycetota bacterium]